MNRFVKHTLPRLVVLAALIFLGVLFWAARTEPGPEPTELPEASASPPSGTTPTAAPAPQPLATVARDGAVTLQLELDADVALEGTLHPARLVVINHSPQHVQVHLSRVLVLEPSGLPLDDNAWYMPLPGQPEPELRRLAPGQTSTSAHTIWIPPLEEGEPHNLAAWGEADYSVELAQGGLDPHRLQAGPLPISVADATPERRLRTQLTADAKGWSLRLQLPNGDPPPEAWAALEGTTSWGSVYTEQTGPITDGLASGDLKIHEDEQVAGLRALVSAPGYSTEVVTASLGLPRRSSRYHEQRASVHTREEAERFLGTSVTSLPRTWAGPPVALAAVEVISLTQRFSAPAASGELYHYQSVTLDYRLDGGEILRLSQHIYEEDSEWGYSKVQEMEEVTLARDDHGRRAFLGQRFGRWQLGWDLGRQQIELDASATFFSREELLDVARHVVLPALPAGR